MRPHLDITKLDESQQAILDKTLEQFKRYGPIAMVSSHEIQGLLDEEVHELHHAVHSNDMSDIRAELIDVAVTALWGIMSIDQGKLDWPKED